MSFQLRDPIIYLITGGKTTYQTTSTSEEFAEILKLVSAAVAANVSLLQIREKNLSARVLYELTSEAVGLTRGSQIRLLVNDRADIAEAAGAHGVHLTTSSLSASVVRRTFGSDFLIGVSTHSLEEASAARETKADFAVWGPVFATDSKRPHGEPKGTGQLAEVVRAVAPFPIIALGGITLTNVVDCFTAGANGVAGIGMFRETERLAETVSSIRGAFESQK